MYFLITCQPKRVNSPGGTSLLPAMVGSDVPSLICILSVEILWTESFKKNCLNSCPESKELLRITRDNWVLVSMRGRRLLVLMCTKYYVNNYIRERVMTIFLCSFLPMNLNLMVISNNCVNTHVQHIQWRSDCLIFCFWDLKGNQTEHRANDPWHVYSNPKNTTTFPVLAMAKYLFLI